MSQGCNIRKIFVKVHGGSDFWDSLEKCKQIAKEFNCVVILKFNGNKYNVYPFTNVNEVELKTF